jgi:hypothetical protein
MVDYGRKRGHEAGKEFKFTLTTNAGFWMIQRYTVPYTQDNLRGCSAWTDGREVQDPCAPNREGRIFRYLCMDRD